MKRLILIMFLSLLSVSVHGYGIVNNSGSAPADSLTIPFVPLDSIGNITTLASGDSVFLIVYYPSGGVAYRDSLAYNGSKIVSQTISSYTGYAWKEAVATLDGTPKEGVYSYLLITKDATGAALGTPCSGYFQLYDGDDFNVQFDKLNDIIDSLYAVIDTLQSQDNWVSSLTTSDNIGVNFNDIAGTLDSPEIGSNAIGSDELAASAIDKILEYDTANIASGFGQMLKDTSVYQGSSAGLDTTDIRAMMLNNQFARVTVDTPVTISAAGRPEAEVVSISGSSPAADSLEKMMSGGFGLDLAHLHVRATGNDTAAIFKGAGAGQGMFIQGGSTADAMRLLASGTDKSALYALAIGAGGVGIYGDAVGSNGYAFKLDAPSGTGVRSNGSLAALELESASGNGLTILAGDTGLVVRGNTGADIYAVDIEGSLDVTIAGGYIDSNKTEQGGIAGANRTLSLLAVDTSGVDDTLDAVVLTLQSAAGVTRGVTITDASGYGEFTVVDGDWRVLGSKNGYVIHDSLFNISSNDTIVLSGQDIPVPPPSSGATCRVYGYLYDINQQPETTATVAAWLPAGVSRAGGLIISPFSIATTTDSTGYFYLDLIPSDSLLPIGSKYEISINRRDGTILRQRIAVPASDTWQLTW